MDLKRKQVLCTALLLLNDEEEVAKKKEQGEAFGGTVAPKKGWTRNLQQSLPRITGSKITQRLY